MELSSWLLISEMVDISDEKGAFMVVMELCERVCGGMASVEPLAIKSAGVKAL